MRIQSIVILVIAVLTMAVFSTWEFTQRRIDQAYQQLQNTTRKNANQLHYVLSKRVEQAQRELDLLFKYRNSGFKGQGAFLHIVELKYSEKNDLEIQWMRNLDPSLANWSDRDIINAIQPLSLANLPPIYFGRVSSKDSQPYIATMIPKGDTIHLGFLPMYFFSDVDQHYKGESNEALVIDDRGYALVYPERRYLASKIAGHTIVKSILLEKQARGFGEYINFHGQTITGAYEKVTNSNIYGAVSHVVPHWKSFVSQELLSQVAVAAAIILLAIGFLLAFQTPFINQHEYLLRGVVSLAQQLPVQPPSGKSHNWLKLERILVALQDKVHPSPQDVPLQKETQQEDTQSEGIPKVSLERDKADSKVATKPQEDLKEMKGLGLTLIQSCRGVLSVILGHVQMAREKVVKDDVVEHLTIIERETRQLQSTNDKLLKIVGHEEPNLVKVDFRKVFLDVLGSLRELINNKKIKVSKDMQESLPLYTIEDQLKDLLHRLLKMSMDSIMENAPRKELEMGLFRVDSNIHLSMRDTGRGIPTQTLNQIFDPLYSSQKEDESVLGVELTIIRGLVKSLGGEIEVSSELNEGSTFFLVFPIDQKKTLSDSSPLVSQVVGTLSIENESVDKLGGQNPMKGSTHFPAPPSPMESEIKVEFTKPGEDLIDLLQDKESHVNKETNLEDTSVNWEDKTQLVSLNELGSIEEKLTGRDTSMMPPEESQIPEPVVPTTTEDISWEDKTQFIPLNQVPSSEESPDGLTLPEMATTTPEPVVPTTTEDISWEDKTQFTPLNQVPSSEESPDGLTLPEMTTTTPEPVVPTTTEDISWEDKTQFIPLNQVPSSEESPDGLTLPEMTTTTPEPVVPITTEDISWEDKTQFIPLNQVPSSEESPDGLTLPEMTTTTPEPVVPTTTEDISWEDKTQFIPLNQVPSSEESPDGLTLPEMTTTTPEPVVPITTEDISWEDKTQFIPSSKVNSLEEGLNELTSSTMPVPPEAPVDPFPSVEAAPPEVSPLPILVEAVPSEDPYEASPLPVEEIQPEALGNPFPSVEAAPPEASPLSIPVEAVPSKDPYEASPLPVEEIQPEALGNPFPSVEATPPEASPLSIPVKAVPSKDPYEASPLPVEEIQPEALCGYQLLFGSHLSTLKFGSTRSLSGSVLASVLRGQSWLGPY